MTLSEIDGQNALARREPGTAIRRLPNHTVSDLLIPVSCAIDLAEGRDPGHAQRVAFIALSIANTLGLDTQQRLATCYAGLMHDIGVVSAGARLTSQGRGDERLIFASMPLLSPEEAALGVTDANEDTIDKLMEHSTDGAHFAEELSLPSEAIEGISNHHECWDGTGYPHGYAGPEIPIVGRIIALADHVESMISQASPLQARRFINQWLSPISGTLTDPQAVQALRSLANGDEFWLGLNSPNLSAELGALCSRLRETKAARLLPFAEAFSQLVDSRFPFTTGISARVAKIAEALGRAAGFTDVHVRLLRAAALLHDIGQLAMSERIISKPGILTVEELDMLQMHPLHSGDVVAEIPGLEEVAIWVATHHERPDGRGYPDRLSGADIPLEARILAVADTYVAMTSDRPHRPRVEPSEAIKRMRAAAGSQLDGGLVDLFISSGLN